MYWNSSIIPAIRSSSGRETPSRAWVTKPRNLSASLSGRPSMLAMTRTGMFWEYSRAASTTSLSPISAISSWQ